MHFDREAVPMKVMGRMFVTLERLGVLHWSEIKQIPRSTVENWRNMMIDSYHKTRRYYE